MTSPYIGSFCCSIIKGAAQWVVPYLLLDPAAPGLIRGSEFFSEKISDVAVFIDSTLFRARVQYSEKPIYYW